MTERDYCVNAAITIHDLDIDDRPREKLQRHGVAGLSDQELLAILLGSGRRDKSALDLAMEIMKKFPGADLMEIELEELTSISGVGQAKASRIIAGLELGKRLSKKRAERSFSIRRPETVAEIYMEDLRYEKQEYFFVLLLDSKNRIFSKYLASKGTLNASIVHPRDVYRIAIKKGANAIICLHNHPSGDPHPSKEDVLVTKRLREAGELIGIKLLDHIIIGDGKFCSLNREMD